MFLGRTDLESSLQHIFKRSLSPIIAILQCHDIDLSPDINCSTAQVLIKERFDNVLHLSKSGNLIAIIGIEFDGMGHSSKNPEQEWNTSKNRWEALQKSTAAGTAAFVLIRLNISPPLPSPHSDPQVP
jgi:hypothetical protein